MKKLLSLLAILLFGIASVQAQENYSYYYQSEKIPLHLDRQFVNIFTDGDFNSRLLTDIGITDFKFITDNTENGQRFAKLKFTSPLNDKEYGIMVNQLRQLNGVKHVAPFFERGSAEPIGTSNHFYIKLKKANDTRILKKVAKLNNATVVKQVPNMPLWYIVSLNDGTDITSVEATNRFYKTGSFADVDPAFMFDFSPTCTNDTDFGSLWGLNNTSNPSIDINACQAWTITEGNGVNVAIQDQGIHKAHNDLAANIHPLSFDAESGTAPSVYNPSLSHGTHVAGTVGAVKNNNLQVVGVAPQSKLMSVSHELYISSTLSAELAGGFSWAWQNGADVINNSWGDQGGNFYGQMHSTVLENAIITAMSSGRGGKGTLVVFAAGNYGSSGAIMDYPGNFHNDIVTAGAITSTGSRSYFSGYGTKLDVVAPGSNILSTTNGNNTAYYNGTSMAAPHVTGTIALILSVNPCLTGLEVRDILEGTAQKIGGYSYVNTAGRPNGKWNNEMGYGLIDAYAAVTAAKALGGGIDLYMKDNFADVGDEPNNTTSIMWNSQDIWVRTFHDWGTVHQNPDYSAAGNPNTVYVKVRNRGCLPTKGFEQLNLYWSKAGTSLQWPTHWNGSTFPTGELKGKIIGTATIPVLQPGQETVIPFAWVVPNPNDYAGITPGDQWHFCLLARMISPDDPMTYVETTDLFNNVKYNNNIAWRNTTVVDTPINSVVGPVGGVVAVENTFDQPHMFTFEFGTFEEDGVPVTELAEVKIRMNDVLLAAWEAAGGYTDMIEPQEDGNFIVTGNFAEIRLQLEPEQTGIMEVTFNFPPEQQTEELIHTFHIIQRDTETKNIVGGETYTINRAESDEVNADDANYITTMSPNPASDDVAVKYHLFEAESAYLAVYSVYGADGETNYYDLEAGSGDFVTEFNVSDYANGYYTVVLMVNGEAVDSKNLLKE